MKSPTSRIAAAIAATLVLPAIAAASGSENAQTVDDSHQWEWGATLYLWLPSLGGDSSFPPGGGGPSIGVSAETFLDNLNSAFMGAFEGRRGRWALTTDVIYIDVGSSENATRDLRIGQVDLPVSVTADLSLDIKGWLWTLVGSYQALRQENFAMDVVVGARVLDLEEDLHWTFNGDISSLPVPGPTGTGHAKSTQLDAIVGLKGRASFGTERSWYIPYYVDIGAGDSNLTWQGMAGLGYSFDSVDVAAVWRYLDYDLGNGTLIESINFNGPALGMTLKF